MNFLRDINGFMEGFILNVAERVKTKESGPRAALFKTLRVLQMVLLGLPEAFDLVFSKL